MSEQSPVSARAAQKRARILQAATELFINLGYRKTSVEDIATRAGVAKGTVYLSFRSKAEILKAAISAEEEGYLERTRPILTDTMDDRERLRLWVVNLVMMGSSMPLTFRMLRGDTEIITALDELPDVVLRRQHELTLDFTKDLVEAATAPRRWTEAALHECATVIGGLTHYWGTVSHSPLGELLSNEQTARILAQSVVDGLGDHTDPASVVDGLGDNTDPLSGA